MRLCGVNAALHINEKKNVKREWTLDSRVTKAALKLLWARGESRRDGR